MPATSAGMTAEIDASYAAYLLEGHLPRPGMPFAVA
jgi:hypothetical protein